jgi:hypothetical protein
MILLLNNGVHVRKEMVKWRFVGQTNRDRDLCEKGHPNKHIVRMQGVQRSLFITLHLFPVAVDIIPLVPRLLYHQHQWLWLLQLGHHFEDQCCLVLVRNLVDSPEDMVRPITGK